MSVNWEGSQARADGHPRMTETDRLPGRIGCSCGRMVDADDVALCQVCDKVLCETCGTETELETRCCDACMVRHVAKLEWDRHYAEAARREAERWQNTWRKRYESARNTATACMCFIAALAVIAAWWAIN